MKKKVKVWLILSCIIIASGISITVGVLFSFQAPTARSAYGMVYDQEIKNIILFGGGAQEDTYTSFGDTWLYDPATNKWTEIFTYNHPSARSSHVMVYDPINRKTILFGGIDSNDRWLNETWIFNSRIKRWIQVFPENSPSHRGSVSMYYDEDASKVILFGGYQASGGPLDDTWAYDYINNTWIQLNPLSNPSGRYGAPMVYDPVNQRGFMFGGRSSTITDDNWVYYYSNNSWNQLNISTRPSSRYWEGLAFDEDTQKIILFGGRATDGVGDGLEDTWIFDPVDNMWTEIFPTSHPSHRFHLTLVYCPENHETILFGGFRFTDTNFGDVWAFDYSSNDWDLRFE